MARVKDLWVTAGGEKTAKHPDNGGNKAAKRWLAVWDGADGKECAKAFRKRSDAEDHLEALDAGRCIVPDCRHHAETEPPVLLCGDHRDLLIKQVTRKKPGVHDPLVYFIRHGDRVKIGWTTNLNGRVSTLALPRDSVALTIPGGPAEEKMLHRHFARSQVGRSEWFTVTPEIEQYIAARRQAA